MSEKSCNHDHCDHDHEEETASVTLTLENDQEVECAILTIFDAGDHSYIALLPLDEHGESQDGDVYIYRFQETDGEPELENIENDEEYEAAADAFDEWLDTQEYLDEGGEEL